MLDLFVPAGALAPDAERTLVDELTTVLLKAEGADPANPAARKVSWVFLHRPEVFVGGAPAPAPVYRVIASVPEGQLNGAEVKRELVAEVTAAILRAEGTPAGSAKDQARVWVFPLEVPEGHWGSAGRIFGLADILAGAIGDADKADHVASERIAASRKERALG
jgi:phenylpyruvate tautomerase PptA (4-oxalocrotonate tautomerase family)